MSKKAFDRFSGAVSVGKVSITPEVAERRLWASESSFSGLRARRATA